MKLLILTSRAVFTPSLIQCVTLATTFVAWCASGVFWLVEVRGFEDEFDGSGARVTVAVVGVGSIYRRAEVGGEGG